MHFRRRQLFKHLLFENLKSVSGSFVFFSCGRIYYIGFRTTTDKLAPQAAFVISPERYSTQEVAVRIDTVGSICLPRLSHVAGQSGNLMVGKFC
jgi:hypothetical protein